MTYYELLYVAEDASEEEIKAAYREQIKFFHPDTYEGDPGYAEEQTRALNEAYRTLMDPVLRQEYDDEIGLTGEAIVREQIRRHGEEARARLDAMDEQKRLDAIRNRQKLYLQGQEGLRMRYAAIEALVVAALLLIIFLLYHFTA